jgi:ureidoglycolate lyase
MIMSIAISAEPLTAAAISPFATVLEAAAQKATVFDAVFEQSDLPGAFAFTILRADPVSTELVGIEVLERHPHSAQSFLPMAAGRWLVLVAPDAPDGSPDLSLTKAFLATPGQSVCIHRNVWHAPLTVFDQPSKFGMIMWKSTAGVDGVVQKLERPISIMLR